jgi:hypothetical protein
MPRAVESRPPEVSAAEAWELFGSASALLVDSRDDDECQAVRKRAGPPQP